MRELTDILEAHRRLRGEALSLATLVRVKGSSYRSCGARMLILPDGHYIGGVSGGCVEREIVCRSRDVTETGVPELVTFDTRARNGCHGQIEVVIERVRDTFLDALGSAFCARRSCIAATSPAAGSVVLECEGAPPGEVFVQRIDPPVRLLIIGKAPDSLAVRGYAQILGWQCESAEDIHHIDLAPDAWTAAIVGTHNYGRDFTALHALLNQGLLYVGLISSPRRRTQMIADLLASGVEPGQEFFCPAGLDLGADAPEQIALAVVAEIQRVVGRGTGCALRETSATSVRCVRHQLAAA